MDPSQRITQSSSLEANQQPSKTEEQLSNAKPLTSQTLGMIPCWDWREHDSPSLYGAPTSTSPLSGPSFPSLLARLALRDMDTPQNVSPPASLEATQSYSESEEQSGNSVPIQMTQARGWNLTEFDSFSLYEMSGPTPPLSYSAFTSTDASLIATPHLSTSLGERFTRQTHYTFNPDELSAAVSRKSTGSTMSIDIAVDEDVEQLSSNGRQSPVEVVAALRTEEPQPIAEPPMLDFTAGNLHLDFTGAAEPTLFAAGGPTMVFDFTGTTAMHGQVIEDMFAQTTLPAISGGLGAPQDKKLSDAETSFFNDFLDELDFDSAQ